MSATSRNRSRTPRVVTIMTIAMLICAMGCSARQPAVERDDASISNDVRARLAADTQVSPLEITVDTKAGIVHLTGSVATDDERTSVERIARAAPGVRSVDNDVRFGAVSAPVKPSTL
jgi:osmotically-inducible protein OsmY